MSSTAVGGMNDVMTLAEVQRSRELEAVVEAGMQTFMEVGRALLELRDGRLYRATHDTWETYCQERWGWKRHYANRLIAAAETAAAVVPMGTIENERQARALTGLAPDQQRETYHRAQEQSGSERPTAQQLRAARVDRGTREIEPDDEDDDPPLTQEECEALEAAPQTKVSKLDTPRQRPLSDVAKDAGWELRRAVDKIERVLADPRLTRNAEQVTNALRGHLLDAAERVPSALDRLSTNHEKGTVL